MRNIYLIQSSFLDWIDEKTISSKDVQDERIIYLEKDGLEVSDYQSLIYKIEEANASSVINKITLVITSSGGQCLGLGYAIQTIEQSKKPIEAIINSYAFSAGYWLACACNKTYVSDENAGVGSIGSIMVLYDESKYFKKLGVKKTVIKDGSKKALGNFETLTDEIKADFQEEVSKITKDFRGFVISKRALDADWKDESQTYLAKDAPFLFDGIKPLSFYQFEKSEILKMTDVEKVQVEDKIKAEAIAKAEANAMNKEEAFKIIDLVAKYPQMGETIKEVYNKTGSLVAVQDSILANLEKETDDVSTISESVEDKKPKNNVLEVLKKVHGLRGY